MRRAWSGRFSVAVLFTCLLGSLVLASSARDGQVTTQSKTSDVKPTESRQGQSRKRFEVVSVRRGTESGAQNGPRILPGGRFEMDNFFVTAVISRAYRMRLANAPAWAGRERYSIRAKATDGASPQEIEEMLRTLLAEEFGMVAHEESRETQVYALSTLHKDKRLGRWLRPRTTPCPVNERVPVPSFMPGAQPIPVFCGSGTVSPISVLAAGVTMSTFGSILSAEVGVGAPVVDHTGLPGTFDITLRYSTVSGAAPTDAEWPSLFSAVEEQLGLRLLQAREPRPVLVIEKLERPTNDAN